MRQGSALKERTQALGSEGPGFKSQLSFLLAVWSWHVLKLTIREDVIPKQNKCSVTVWGPLQQIASSVASYNHYLLVSVRVEYKEDPRQVPDSHSLDWTPGNDVYSLLTVHNIQEITSRSFFFSNQFQNNWSIFFAEFFFPLLSIVVYEYIFELFWETYIPCHSKVMLP